MKKTNMQKGKNGHKRRKSDDNTTYDEIRDTKNGHQHCSELEEMRMV